MAAIGDVKRTPATVCEFEWSIPEFASLSAEDYQCYGSPSFEVFGESCLLFIYPNDFRSSSPFVPPKDPLGYVVVRFLLPSSQKPPIVPEVSFAIRNADGNKDQERHNLYQSLGSVFLQYSAYCYISRTELLERASELMPSNTLTVICTVKYTESIDSKSNSETSNCAHCKGVFDAKTISFHEKNCFDKPVKCPECSEDFWRWSYHACQSTKKAGETASAKCKHCQELVDAKTISLHEKKCLIKCPECSEVVALKNWHDHECHTTKPEGEPCTSGIDLQYRTLAHDFKELFQKKENCDVVIRVKGEEFPAHKIILEARSSIFASTFRSDMKERSTGVVKIDDCDPSCFSDFLCFLYSGEVDISKENVFSLFTVADKYDVQNLRVKCLAYMEDNLSVDTFCDTLALALLHSETDLIKLSTHFFIKNAPKIILTVQWQIFLKENPTQSNELFIKLLAPDASLNK